MHRLTELREQNKWQAIVMDKILNQLIPATKVVVILSFVAAALHLFNRGSDIDLGVLGTSLFYNAYYGFALSFVNGWFFDMLSVKYPWEANPRRRAMTGIIGSILLTMLTLFVLNWLLWVVINGNDMSVLWAQRNRNFYTVGLFITILISSIFHAIQFYNEVQKEKKLNISLKQEMLETELNALRAHVDPHFLFNSFNVLSGLIDEDQEKAQDFLTGLSKIYRYILEQRNKNTTTLEDEIDFAKRYVRLQKTRFEESIDLDINISNDSLSKELPSLTLQLLLENAIKHNAFSKEEPLKISILDNDHSLIMTNNVKERSNLAISNKVGLQNIKDRFALLGERNIEITKSADEFKVVLPLL